METKIDGGFLTIRIPLQPPTPSKSGKTLVVASTHGNSTTTAMFNGQPIIIGLNAFIRAGKPSAATDERGEDA